MQPIFQAGELRHHMQHLVHCVIGSTWRLQAILQKRLIFSLEYLDLLQLSIISNGLSIGEERIENLLCILPYQFEPIFDSNGLENHITWGINMITYKVHSRHVNQIYKNI